MAPNEEFHIFTILFGHPKRGQPLYKGQNAWSQGCPLYGGSIVSGLQSLYIQWNLQVKDTLGTSL